MRIIAVPGLRWAKDRISPWQPHLSNSLAFASDVCFQQGRGCRDFVACNLPIITLCLQRRIPSMVWDMPVRPSLSAKLLFCALELLLLLCMTGFRVCRTYPNPFWG